jgi:hypothetical protein
MIFIFFHYILIYPRVTLSAHTITLPTESSTSNQEWIGAVCWGGTGLGNERRFPLDVSVSVLQFIRSIIFSLKSQLAVHYQFLVSIQSRLTVGREDDAVVYTPLLQ